MRSALFSKCSFFYNLVMFSLKVIWFFSSINVTKILGSDLHLKCHYK